MKVSIPHNTTQADAIARVKRMIDEQREKITEHATDVEEQWEGHVLHYSFTAQGKTISGTLTVGERDFELYAKLPLSLRLFEGTIERMIEAEAKKIKL